MTRKTAALAAALAFTPGLGAPAHSEDATAVEDAALETDELGGTGAEDGAVTGVDRGEMVAPAPSEEETPEGPRRRKKPAAPAQETDPMDSDYYEIDRSGAEAPPADELDEEAPRRKNP